MKKIVSVIIGFFLVTQSFAQLPVGHMSINFKDASRSGGYSISGGVTMAGTGRTIGTEVYYPATVAGNNQPVASGQYPIVVFGHGFAMTYDNYDNVYNRLASLGYIVLLPRTESGILPTPSHGDFAADLKLLASQGMALNTINTPTALAIFNGKVLQKSAIGGHSMGGGCSYVAAQSNTTVTCLFNMAAATSNTAGVSSVAGASLVTVPTLVISGQMDNVADTTVQNSHYNPTASTKKFHVIIKDVTHCDFGNGTSTTCTIGQAACGNTTCNMSLFRRYMTYLEPFLENQLKGVCQAGKQFMDTIQAPSVVRVGRKITGTLYTPFSVSISGNTTVCSGNSTILTANGASTYTWTGGVVNGAQFTPSATQVYTVSGTNTLGCTATNTTQVIVNASPTVAVNSGSICSGSSFTLSPTGANTYTFSNGGTVVSPTVTSTYSITGTGSNGCVSSVAVSTVTVNSKPVISVNSGSVCAGNSFTLSPTGANTYTYSSGSAVVTPTATTSYSVTGTSVAGCTSSVVVSTVTVNSKPVISVNSGSVCAGNSFTLSPTGANTYTYSSGTAVVTPTATTSYSVTGTSVAGCTSSIVVSTVTVNSKPVISVNSGSVCSGNSFTLSPTGANTYTYSSGSAVVTPTATTSYSVTGTSVAGCTSSVVVSTVTVNSMPVISVNSGSVCAGNSFTLYPTGANTYTYSGGSAVVIPTVTTSYSVTGTSIAGCTSSVVVSMVTVNALPVLLAVTNNTLLCAGQPASLSVSGANTYTWNTNENTTTIVVSPTTTTIYSVQGTDANGCMNSTTVTQDVSTCTGINANELDGVFTIYPNPTQGLIVVEASSAISIFVTDVLGNHVFTEVLSEGKHIIQLDNQPNGIYFLKVNKDEFSKTLRIIKQ